MNWFLLAAAGLDDVLFVAIVVGLVLGGVGLVFWSRRKGASQAGAGGPGPEPEPAEEEDKAGPEAVPEEAPAPEAVPERAIGAPPVAPELKPQPKGRTIRDGLAKTRSEGFVSRLAGLFRKELDQETETKLEEVLLTADIGIKTAQKLLARIKGELSRSQLKDPQVVWNFLKEEVRMMLAALERQGAEDAAEGKPHVIVVVGVNGTGKTTSIGKLAARYVGQGRRVLIVAADTFRAAAVDQLEIWAQRSGAAFFPGKNKQDPAAVAFDGLKQGLAGGFDVVIVDTAGRLHTHKGLVEELKKIIKVCGKALSGAPHETLLVLDATTGQNAIQQAGIFQGEVGVQGIVLSKLDGTAKGGVIIGISDSLGLPVKYVGVGEKVEDLQPFSADDFVEGLFGRALP
jgi:fused signal recognition particle receptor